MSENQSAIDALAVVLDEAERGEDGGAWQDRLATAVLASDWFTERLAEAWRQGCATGTSRAMRMMSDEPSLPLASDADNPYGGAR